MKITVYSPDPLLKHPGRLFLEMARDLYAARELAWRLMVRNLSAMYRQTILGYVWAFLPPLFAAGTFIALRSGGVLQVADIGIPYIPWVLAGTFLWQTFADAINAPMRQVSQAKSMLTKINFPRESLIMAGIGETLFNFLVRMFILVPVLLYFGVSVEFPAILFFPLVLITLVLLGVMAGVLLTPIAVLYQDIEKGIPLLLPFLMILSGAVVPIPATGMGKILGTLNPIYPVLETTRNLLIGQPPILWTHCIVIGAAAWILLMIGWVIYRIAMPHLIARLGG